MKYTNVIAAIKSPGIIPAINRSPTEILPILPKRTTVVLGGMMTAKEPVAKIGPQLSF